MKWAQVQKHSVALNIKRSLKNNTGDVKAINYNKVQWALILLNNTAIANNKYTEGRISVAQTVTPTSSHTALFSPGQASHDPPKLTSPEQNSQTHVMVCS